MLILGGSQITDISPLGGLTNLFSLRLAGNQISDVSPLIANPGLGQGDHIDLSSNPLSDQSVNEYIPELEARGVIVEY